MIYSTSTDVYFSLTQIRLYHYVISLCSKMGIYIIFIFFSLLSLGVSMNSNCPILRAKLDKLLQYKEVVASRQGVACHCAKLKK